MKRLLSLSFIMLFSSLFSADESKMALFIPQENIVTRNMHEPFAVGHDNEGFFVAQENKISRVNQYDTSSDLRKMDINKAAHILSASKIKLTRLSNGEYTVVRHGEIKGGGPVLAQVGFWVGYSIPHIIQHTCAAIVAIPAAATGGPLAGTIAYGSFVGSTEVLTKSTAQALGLAGSIAGWTVGPVAP